MATAQDPVVTDGVNATTTAVDTATYRLVYLPLPEGGNVTVKDMDTMTPMAAVFAVKRCVEVAKEGDTAGGAMEGMGMDVVDVTEEVCTDLSLENVEDVTLTLTPAAGAAAAPRPGWDPRGDDNNGTIALVDPLPPAGAYRPDLVLYGTATVALAPPFADTVGGADVLNVTVGPVFFAPPGTTVINCSASITFQDGVDALGQLLPDSTPAVVVDTLVEAVPFTVLPQPESIAVVNTDSSALEQLPVQILVSLRDAAGAEILPLAGGNITVTANSSAFTPVIVPYDPRSMASRPFGLVIEFPLVGDYNLELAFERSDGVVLRTTRTFTVALGSPRVLVSQFTTQCISRLPFVTQPEFRLYMDLALTRLAPVYAVAIFSLSISRPSYTYTTANRSSDINNPWGSMTGMNRMENHTVVGESGVFRSSGLGIDRAGDFEIRATVVINDEVFAATERVVCYDLPAYTPPATSEVNSRLRMLFYGFLHFAEAAVVSMKARRDCLGGDVAPSFRFPIKPDTNIAQFTNEADALSRGTANTLLPVYTEDNKERLIWMLFTDFVPTEPTDTAYVCITLDSDLDTSVLLWQYYVQRHSEAIPVQLSFGITAQGECYKMTRFDVIEYRTAPLHTRWLDVAEGRRYGCRLEPPVNGSISPCACALGQICTDFEAAQGNHTLNVGICECCEPWLYAVLFSTGGLLLVGVSWWILRL